MQLLIVLIATVSGLYYGSQTEGFIFDSNICLFAGLTLIMPSLFEFRLKDVGLLFIHKGVLFKGFVLNYMFIPIIAIGIGLLTDNFGIAAGIFLLSVLSGGGMVMHWIRRSNADTSLGFLLLFINLILVSFSLLLMHYFGIYTSEYFGESYVDEINMSNFADAVINLLIIIPFIASRIVIFIKPVKVFIERFRPYISGISIFIILFYLFGLQNSQLLIEIYEFEPELIYISIAAVLGFYTATLLTAYLTYSFDSAQDKSAFWHTVTRYITLALVISTFSTSTFGVSMILPIMIAYVVQVPTAILLDKKFTHS